MILIPLLFQYAPPSPVSPPPPPTAARSWTCDMAGPNGDRFRIAGDFDRVEVGAGPMFGIVQTTARISEGPQGQYVGSYKAGYAYGEPRAFNFAHREGDQVTNFSYQLVAGKPGALLVVKRQKQQAGAPFEAIGVGYCAEQVKGRTEA